MQWCWRRKRWPKVHDPCPSGTNCVDTRPISQSRQKRLSVLNPTDTTATALLRQFSTEQPRIYHQTQQQCHRSTCRKIIDVIKDHILPYMRVPLLYTPVTIEVSPKTMTMTMKTTMTTIAASRNAVGVTAAHASNKTRDVLLHNLLSTTQRNVVFIEPFVYKSYVLELSAYTSSMQLEMTGRPFDVESLDNVDRIKLVTDCPRLKRQWQGPKCGNDGQCHDVKPDGFVYFVVKHCDDVPIIVSSNATELYGVENDKLLNEVVTYEPHHNTCIRCDKTTVVVTENGVTYCAQHARLSIVTESYVRLRLYFPFIVNVRANHCETTMSVYKLEECAAVRLGSSQRSGNQLDQSRRDAVGHERFWSTLFKLRYHTADKEDTGDAVDASQYKRKRPSPVNRLNALEIARRRVAGHCERHGPLIHWRHGCITLATLNILRCLVNALSRRLSADPSTIA